MQNPETAGDIVSSLALMPRPNAIEPRTATAAQLRDFAVSIRDELPRMSRDELDTVDALLKAAAARLRQLGKDADEAEKTRVRLLQRIGELLGPADRGGDRGNQYTGGKLPFGNLPKEPLVKKRDHAARLLAEFSDVVEQELASNKRVSISRVVRACQRARGDATVGGVSTPQHHLIKPGEWWRLGRHHLYCGDTSTQEFSDQLVHASLAFADPPYNAGADEWDSGFIWRHDWLIEVADVVIVTPGIVSIFDFARSTAMPYAWSIACWITNGMTRGAMGFGNWIYAAAFSHGSIYRNAQDFIKVTVNNAETTETEHKGRKPTGFISYLVDTFTEPEDVIVDPFLGSGTSLLVAEKLGRTCIGGEISPDFCAEITARWEALSGLTAVKL